MRRFSQVMAFMIGGVVAFAMLQSLSGCSQGYGALDQVVRVFGVGGIDQAGQRELSRFYKALDTYSNDPSEDRQHEHFRDAFRLVRANYVVKVRDSQLIDAALKGVLDLDPKPGAVNPSVLVEAALDSMMASLDPHSSYLNPTEYKESQISTKGEFGGLGLEVTLENDVIKVVSPIEDTPAFRAGIQSGDLITHLDGMPIKGKTLTDAVRVMRGLPGTKITLTIARADMPSFDVTLVRAVILVRSIRWRLEGDIGYIQVVSFTEQVSHKLAQGMLDMFASARAANTPLLGVVLDLRNNPGGLLDQSLFVSDAFLNNGEIVSVRERNPRRSRVYMAKPGDLSYGLPLVVLINEGSASASEIVAGALKDQGRAVIMGRRSFGKGSVQTIQPMPIGGALRLTTARYYAPSGHTIQARGVGPDIVLSRSLPLAGEKAKKIIHEADLPGALAGDALPEKPVRATIARETCPRAGPKGDDFDLGCALAYLHTGTTAAFLKAVAPVL